MNRDNILFYIVLLVIIPILGVLLAYIDYRVKCRKYERDTPYQTEDERNENFKKIKKEFNENLLLWVISCVLILMIVIYKSGVI